MKYSEFRKSSHQVAMALFLKSPTGREFMQTLRETARPSVAARTAHGTHDDVKLQMALNLVASIERHQLIDEMEQLATPLTEIKRKTLEPLEAE